MLADLRPFDSQALTPLQLEQLISQTLQQRFSHSTFKSSEQMEGILAVLKEEPLLSVVLPTGGGKSLLFMLPAAIEKEGVTVVIVPFISLVNDLIDRCKAYDLEVVEWTSEQSSWATITIVVVERTTAMSVANDDSTYLQTFLQSTSVLAANGQLKRIVFDECHTIITQQHFRPAMSKLFELQRLKVPLLFLTATLPPALVTPLERMMVLKHVCYIRASSFRGNIGIRINWCDNGKALSVTARLVKAFAQTMEPGQRTIVYCKTVKQAQTLSNKTMLNCSCYHSNLTVEERSSAIERWMQSGEQYLVATTAFGTGVDVQGVVATFHANIPYGLVDFIQESGRGGRTGERSLSTIIVEERELQMLREEVQLAGGFLKEDKAALYRFLSTTRCRTLEVTRFLDGGDGRTCDEEGCEVCDLCLSSKQRETNVSSRLSVSFNQYFYANK